MVRPPVGLRHIRIPRSEMVIVAPYERVMPLHIDVVADHHQCALLVFEVNASSGVGQDERTYAHAAEHAEGTRHPLRPTPFIQVTPPLHGCDRHISAFTDDHLSSVPYRSGAWEIWDFRIRDGCSVS